MTFAQYVIVEWAPTDAPFEIAPSWVDVSRHVRSVRAYSGLRSQRDVAGAGSATLEVNNALQGVGEWLDPNTWYRYRQIRVSTADAVLFHGWIKSVSHNTGFPFGTTQARIEAVDAVGLFVDAATDADFTTYATGTPIGEVVARIINNRAGYVTDGGCGDVFAWIMSTTQIFMGGLSAVSRMPVFVETKQAGNAVQLLTDFLEAEQGRLAAVGETVMLAGRYFDFLAAAQPADATFADDGSGYKWLMNSLVLAAPDETYIDQATIGGQGIENQIAGTPPPDYPPSTFTRTTQSPIADANWALANAEMITTLGAATDTFPRQLTSLVAGPTATTYDSAHPSLLPIAVLDVIYDGTTYKVITVSREHQIDEQGWRCTLGFKSLDRIISAYGGDQIFQVGVSSWGGPDIFGP